LSAFGWFLVIEFLTAFLAFLAGRAHLDDWALHVMARMRGGQWFTTRQKCPGCGFRVHLMRLCHDVLVAEDPGGDGYRCLPCASGRHR
jgi:hypothetical protein